MPQPIASKNPEEVAAKIDAEIRALHLRNTPNVRAIRRKYTKLLKDASPEFVLDLARSLIQLYGNRWISYELIRNHREAFRSLGEAELDELGQGMNSWSSVDTFGRILSGPAWRKGQISDHVIHSWAQSEDLWWRRAALVSTVAWNLRSQGGKGDVARTFAVCRLLARDHEDMVVKAMSWALRELVVHDAEAVEGFLEEYEDALAARVKREVRNKLTTGLKYPQRRM